MTDKAGAYGPVATMPRTGQLWLRRGFHVRVAIVLKRRLGADPSRSAHSPRDLRPRSGKLHVSNRKTKTAAPRIKVELQPKAGCT